MTHPPITIERHSDHSPAMAYCASWQTETHRFHVWLNDKGEPDTVIHRNALDRRGADAHRALRGDSANGKVSLAAIAAAVAAGELDKAREARAAEKAAEKAAYEAEQRRRAQIDFDAYWAEGYRPTPAEKSPHWEPMLTALDARMRRQFATGADRDRAALEYTIGYEQALMDARLRDGISPMPFLISCRGYGEVIEWLTTNTSVMANAPAGWTDTSEDEDEEDED